MIKKTFLLTILLIPLLAANGQDNSKTFVGHQIESDILGRNIPVSVYLPNGYNDLSEEYQCHYVFDGNLIGRAYAGLVDYFSQLGEIPEGIIIGMNHNRRFDNKNYSDFIQKELIPFIDSTYRTNRYRLIAGHSSAGFHASQIYLDSHGLFDSYIIGSPVEINVSLESVLRDSLSNLYVAFAENDFPEIVERCEKLQTSFQKGYTGGLIKIDMISNKDHFSSFPSVIANSFEFIYQGWKLELPEETDKSYQEIIDEHYRELSKKYGYKIIIQEKELYRLSYRLLKENNIKEANELLIYSTGLYPNSAFIRHLLGKSYVKLDDIDNAKLQYSKSLEIFPDNKQAKKEYEILLND